MANDSAAASLAATRAQPLTRNDARTLLLAALGGALEFYDFVVFVFFAKVLGGLFFPPGTEPWLATLNTYGIFAAGYLARPLGGIVMAHFGDKVGRKRMFMLSVFLMALPTLCIGLLPIYVSAGALAPVLLLVLRIVQGIAIGGEIPGAWVFVAEHAPRGRVGFACSVLTSGLTFGILLGSLMAAFLNHRYSAAQLADFGWRIPFIVGGIFGFIAVWLRRWLSETPVFEEIRARKQLVEGMPLGPVLKEHKGGVVLSMLVTWTLTAAIVVVILMTPTLAQTRFNIPAPLAFEGSSLASLFLCIGCVAGGLLVDRIGRGWSMVLTSAAMLAATLALYMDLRSGGAHFIALFTLAGLTCGVVGVVPAVMVGAFPATVRFSGISFSYNVAYAIFGAATPPLIAVMAATRGALAPAEYVAVTAVAGIVVGVLLLGKPRLEAGV